MMPLADLISPVSVDAFLADFVGRCAVHSVGTSDRHSGHFSWDALDALLNNAPAPHPALRVVSAEHGAVTPHSAAQAIAAMRQGTGLVLQEADRYHDALGALADALTAELDEPCRINVYATQPGQAAFPLHADTHDVLVLQLAGNKDWSVTGPSLVDPLFHRSLHPQTPPDDPTPYLRTTLTPGDTLYIPRGHWHQALAMGGPSLHLTVALFRTTGMDLIAFAAEELFQSSLWRASLPLSVGERMRPQEAVSPAHRHHQSALATDLAARLSDPGLLARYRAARLANATPRRPFAVRSHMGSQVGRLWQAHVATVRTEPRDEGLVVHVPGRDLWLPAEVQPALALLFSGEPFRVADACAIAPQLAEETAERIVSDLASEGILHPVSAHPDGGDDTA